MLDWNRLGVPPAPLWELPYEIAVEVRQALDAMALPGPWLNGFRKAR